MRSDQARLRDPAVPAAVPRPLLVAPIGGVSAAVLSRLLADRLSRGVEAPADVVSRLRQDLAALEQAAAEWRAWREASASGSPAVPPQAAAAGSGVCDTAEAAALLGVTPRRVRQLAGEGRLRAWRRSGRWLVSRADVATYRGDGCVRRDDPVRA